MAQTDSVTANARGRFGRYLIRRTLTLVVTLTIGVYIAVVVANLGGYVDNIIRANIDEGLNAMGRGGFFADIPPEDRERVFEETRAQMEDAAGLNKPFLLRCVRWTYSAMRFEWAVPEIWEALPHTLLLFGVAVVVILFASLFISLRLSLRYGSLFDRLMVTLSPISAAPSWVHGLILITIFAAGLHWLPWGGVYDIEIPETRIGYIWMIVRHMILPVGAIFLSAFFTLVYTWRTFFLIHAEEDYVEVARAKGVPDRLIEQRYILRPGLSFVITNFALMVLAFWQTNIALEVFFSWPGIGRLYMAAVQMRGYSPGMVISLMTLFAYLMALSFFLLDVVYMLIDPRVGVTTQQARISLNPWKGTLIRLRGMLSRMRKVRQPEFEIHGWLQTTGRAVGELDMLGWLQAVGSALLELDVTGWVRAVGRGLGGLWNGLKQLRRFPSAILGITIILVLLGMSVYAMIFVPYDEVVSHWRLSSVENLPEKAMPAWTNLFRRNKLPETIILDSRDGTARKESSDFTEGTKEVIITYDIDYPYTGFPQDVVVAFDPTYVDKHPFVTLTWIKPDGSETEIAAFSITPDKRYLVTQDEKLPRRLDSAEPLKTLFNNPAKSPTNAEAGQYQLRINGFLFEPEADMDAKLFVYGQVYGMGGTDLNRRDLWLGLLWGAPAALGVGLGGAVITSMASMLLAAVGVWYGGRVDSFVQRLAEVNLTLPMLPIGIMVYFLLSKNIWVILSVIVVFTVFGAPLKTYRAAFMQVKELPYIEAARAYGAGNGRIIRVYLMPRILPVLVPQLVAMVPGFIFLEATLAMLGVSDRYLPTWGKIIYDAMINGALRGYYYWVLEPLVMLMLTGVAFALVGLALDRILNPRLRVI